ncbi:helix-turn-helix domain-containing protein [Niallia oryzisoli]|uniref:Helix-turn-helix domain-containing protein n=1 Tax=Niallia oryzisoli TaxID=1737571 RepID=A0ABZ2CIC4_9BACI
MKTVVELNEVVQAHKSHHQLNATELAVLDVLAQYSVKEIGRSWLSKSTIAELVGKSRRTIIRVCNRLESLGIISQRVRMRLTGDRAQTSNLIIIQPAVTSDSDQRSKHVTPECHTEETPSLNSNNNNTYLETVVPSNALKDALPKPIYDALARYFNADDMYKYYGILLRAKTRVDRNVMIEDDPEPFIEALNATVLMAKRGKIKNMSNYLFVSWQRATHTVLRRKAKTNGLFYDWLNA